MSESTPRRRDKIILMGRAVIDSDPEVVEEALATIAQAHGYLAPLSWAAGSIVLFIAGVRRMLTSWRLLIIEVIPVVWIWLATYDLKVHVFRGAPLRSSFALRDIALAIFIVALSILATWCNAVFAFSFDEPPPPELRRAVRRSLDQRRLIVSVGGVAGLIVAGAVIVAPHFGLGPFAIILSLVVVAMVFSFVALPVRLLNRRQANKADLRQKIGGAAFGGLLSGIAMAPGYLLNRLGLLMLSIHGLKVFGIIVLSVGSALYAASVTSVKAVKLSTKLMSDAPNVTGHQE